MTTSASSSSVPAITVYKNLLEAHTAFVLDRYAFMENVQAAILCENTDPSGSRAIFGFLKSGQFIELIGGLLHDPDTRNREQAFFTLGNLLAVERDDAIVQRTAAVVLERIGAIFEGLYNPVTPDIRKTAAYVIHNLAMLYNKRGWAIQDASGGADAEKLELFCHHVMYVFNGLLGGDSLLLDINNKATRTDLLYAARFVAERLPKVADLQRVLLEMLGASTVDMRALLEILNQRLCASEDGVDMEENTIPEFYHGDVLDRFHLILTNDAMRSLHGAALWGLSNFVVEAGVADKFAEYDDLYNEVVGKALTAGRPSVRANAIWTLGNMVAHVRDAVLKAQICEDHGIWAAMTEAVSDAHDLGRFKADVVAAESIAKLTGWQALFRPLEDSEQGSEATDSDAESEASEESEESEESDAESDDSDDSDWAPEDEEEEESDDDEETVVAEAEEIKGEDEEMPALEPCYYPPVPNALDLLMVGRVPSANVRYLVNHVKDVGLGTWVAIPADTVLTVDDLTTLQMMGYSVQRGHIAVNPLLLSYI